MLRDKMIAFQNKAEKDFEHSKTIGNTLRYIVAFLLFMSSTIFAAFRMPLVWIIRGINKKKNGIGGGLLAANDKNINQLLGQYPRLMIEFGAEWCGPCIMMEPIMKEFVKNNPSIPVLKVNADFNPQLVKRYKIRGIPQILLIENGVEIKRNVGPLSKKELSDFVNR